MDHLCSLCLVFVMLSRLPIADLWSPAGKWLTSLLSFVMFNCVFVTFTRATLGQTCCLIVSIPDLCHLSYFYVFKSWKTQLGENMDATLSPSGNSRILSWLLRYLLKIIMVILTLYTRTYICPKITFKHFLIMYLLCKFFVSNHIKIDTKMASLMEDNAYFKNHIHLLPCYANAYPRGY